MQPPDVQRLIQIIVEELAAAQRQPAPSRCACHAVLYECCPDRLRGVLEAGATRLGLHATGGEAGGVAGVSLAGESVGAAVSDPLARGVGAVRTANVAAENETTRHDHRAILLAPEGTQRPV